MAVKIYIVPLVTKHKMHRDRGSILRKSGLTKYFAVVKTLFKNSFKKYISKVF
jgi:hypothetical protein